MAALERKFVAAGPTLAPALADDGRIEGYATLFGVPDQSGDVVAKGAFAASLARLAREGKRVRMLWQHDARVPIGVWDSLREDGQGLIVSGRLETAVVRGREALALVRGGAIDGLSIGYRTLRAETRPGGKGRLLREVELWEVSLVTFPMLPEARLGAPRAPQAKAADWEALAAGLRAATAALRG